MFKHNEKYLSYHIRFKFIMRYRLPLMQEVAGSVSTNPGSLQAKTSLQDLELGQEEARTAADRKWFSIERVDE